MTLGTSLYIGQNQKIIELEPFQSMSITGKGQDAAVNPFLGTNCYAIIENIGKNEFTIRIQKKGKVINKVSIEKGEKKNY